MKKICILAPANSEHTEKIVDNLSSNFHVTLFSIHEPRVSFRMRMKELNVTFVSLGSTYILGALRLILTRHVYKSDIFWVHYASGYGAISTFIFKRKGKVLSVWGSDVYEFPFKSYFHSKLIRFILSRFRVVFSTSACMASHLKERLGYEGRIVCTPFGVDTTQFNPDKLQCRFPQKKKSIRIGSCKSLKLIYNQKFLIEVVNKLIERNPTVDVNGNLILTHLAVK